MKEIGNHFQLELEEIKAQGLYRSLYSFQVNNGKHLTFNGKAYLNFSSNNYLDLADDERLKQGAIQAIQEWGAGGKASRLIHGSTSLHELLESTIAKFKQTEAALLFNSGYHANVGVLSQLAAEGDVYFTDELNHASIIDGLRLSKAKKVIYPHLDLNSLEAQLKKERAENAKGKLIIVTESVFSMDGDVAPLLDLLSLAEKYDTWIYLDEAHAVGVFGKTGQGLVEACGISTERLQRVIQMGTFGKAFGSFGAFIAGSKNLIEWLVNRVRTFIYTTSLPPAVLGASLVALRMMPAEHVRRDRLWHNLRTLEKLLQTQWNNTFKIVSPIVPIRLNHLEKTLRASEFLKSAGFWLTAIRYPTVASGTERLRLTVMSSHTDEELARLVSTLGEC
ncbi:MAG: 8-amino-7-oxononanoate synthase [Deltaproteobacteria bacterium]|nr:8-amino-7-oxononanoate synthase [Deltaproteobacteria bacterium]